jgi:hypothetical protein
MTAETQKMNCMTNKKWFTNINQWINYQIVEIHY